MKKIIIINIFCFIFYFSFLVSGNIRGTVKTKDGVLADVVVYIEKIEGKVFRAPEKPAVMDQYDLAFVPHVLPVLAGTTVDFPNSDSTRHNVFSPSLVKRFDLGTYPMGTSKSIVCDKPGVISLLCHVHPEMSAFIVVVETPYFALTNDKGNFRIKDIPAGKYRLTVWHEWATPKVQEIEVLQHRDIIVNFFLEE